MRISDQFLNCVLFLCQNGKPKASAFLLAEEGQPREECHLVTARHVIEAARAKGAPLTVQGHAANGGLASSRPVAFDEWESDTDTDVAFFPLAGRDLLDGFTGNTLDPDNVATDEYVVENDIGPGDEVFTTGLFGLFSGTTSHQPTARFGNIAMMPSDPVPVCYPDGTRESVRGYLIEGRSIGGQSGSPAFVHLPATRRPGFLELQGFDPKGPIPASVLPHLLGIVCGHFDERVRLEALDAKAVANTGIAIVIPAGAVLRAIARWREGLTSAHDEVR